MEPSMNLSLDPRCRIICLVVRGFVTIQTQKGPKHEKNISKVFVNFTFLTIQSKIHYQSINIKNYHNNFINDTPKVSQSSMQ